MVRSRGEEDHVSLYVRFQGDIWVEVDIDDDDVLSVVVDDLMMAEPVEVVDRRAAPVAAEGRARARAIVESCDGPSWDYGPRPF
jgi:hypothetical protein